MPIVFSTGGSVAGTITNENPRRIAGDGSTEMIGGAFVMGAQIIGTAAHGSSL